MFAYNLGHKLRNDVNTQYNSRLTGNLHKDFDKRWRQAGDEENTDIPKYSSLNDSKMNSFLYQKADINVKDASYIKLRDLTFAYTLPQYISTKFYTENLKLSLQASNLFYIAFNGEGIDPEAFDLDNGTRTLRYGPSFSFSISAAF